MIRPMAAARFTLALVLVAAVAGGCKPSAWEETLMDPSPIDASLTQNNKQIQAMVSHTVDTNEREAVDDFYRFWLMDRPSRLSPNVIR